MPMYPDYSSSRLVYADRLRGMRVMNTSYFGDRVEVLMEDGMRYQLYRDDFDDAVRNNWFAPYASQQAYGQTGHTGGGNGGGGASSPMQPGTFQMQPGGVTTYSPVTKLDDGYRVMTVPVSQNPRPPEQKPRNTMKRVYYHNRLRKKS